MTDNARNYIVAYKASRRASEAREALPPGSSRARVTSANARWKSAAEERDRLFLLLSDEERAWADASVRRLA